MRDHNQLGSGVGECLQRRHRCIDTARVGDDAAIVEGNIEIAADQDAAACDALG